MEIYARVERRRRWTAQEKAALLAEVEAEGGKVMVVARRHRISESVLYNWRAAWKAATAVMQAPMATPFIPLGVFGGPAIAIQRCWHRRSSQSRRHPGPCAAATLGLAGSRLYCRTVPGSASMLP
jgi:hypothetical protein